ncbi:MAG TPA: glycosyltransferase family 39 protein [bacterium]|nr:glycosyltransferase family 39 protein [bacterium]
MLRAHYRILLILVLALLLRLYHVTYPFLDHHSWRQTDTAAVARNFYRDHFNLLRPEMDRFGSGPAVVELELQVTPFLTSLLYVVWGVRDWVGRIVPILFSLGSVVYFYRLVALHFGERLALFSSFVFIILPLNVFFSRVLMPEAGALFFTLAAVYHFSAYLGKEATVQYVLAAVFAALAFLAKLSNLYILIVFVALATRKGWRGLVSDGRFFAFLLLSLAPAVAYYGYLHLAADVKMMPYQVGTDKWGNVQLWTNPVLYQVLAQRFRTLVFTEPGLLMLIAGLFFPLSHSVFRLWLMGALAYVFVVANGNLVHTYYQMPLLPAGAFFIGLVLDRTYSSARLRPLTAVLCGLLFARALMILGPLYGMYAYPAYEAAKGLSEIDTSASPVVSVPHRRDMAPELLYYADRKGWVVWPDQLGAESIAQFRDQGAKFIVVTDYRTLPDGVKRDIDRLERWQRDLVLIARL